MSSLKEKYLELIKCLEKHIKEPQELEEARKALSELVIAYSDALNYNAEMEQRINKLEKEFIKIHKRLECIEDDIYLETDDDEAGIDQMHDNDFEFEIICPYCDHQFITDSTFEEETQIKCPKCNRIIELDWADYDDEDECGGHCNSCGGHCYENKKEDSSAAIVNEDDNNYSINVQEPEENKKEKKEDNNEDDDM